MCPLDQITYMNKTELPKFNLHTTLLGGQSFGWDFDGEWYTGFTIDRAAKMKKEGEALIWQTYPIKDDFNWLKKYLKLDTDYEKIMKSITIDQHIKKAIKKFPDLRLLKQDFEETLIAFLCSPTKTIVGIRQCTRLLAQKYGVKIKTDYGEVNLFPRAERLAETTIDELMKCKVGFRAKNILKASEIFSRSDLLSGIESLSSSESIEILKQLPGIGDKVADCIAVYGLGHDEVTPFDVWGKRFAVQYYGLDEKSKYNDMREWAREYFNGYAAWAGQFLFEFIRSE